MIQFFVKSILFKKAVYLAAFCGLCSSSEVHASAARVVGGTIVVGVSACVASTYCDGFWRSGVGELCLQYCAQYVGGDSGQHCRLARDHKREKMIAGVIGGLLAMGICYLGPRDTLSVIDSACLGLPGYAFQNGGVLYLCRSAIPKIVMNERNGPFLIAGAAAVGCVGLYYAFRPPTSMEIMRDSIQRSLFNDHVLERIMEVGDLVEHIMQARQNPSNPRNYQSAWQESNRRNCQSTWQEDY